jgi:hypothetical protein
MATEKQKSARFKGKGLGIGHSSRPICVLLQPELDALVRSLPERSAFVREAIVEKLEREGMVDPGRLTCTNSTPKTGRTAKGTTKPAKPKANGVDPNWIPERGDRVIERATGKEWQVQLVGVESRCAIVVDDGKLKNWFHLDKICPSGG